MLNLVSLTFTKGGRKFRNLQPTCFLQIYIVHLFIYSINTFTSGCGCGWVFSITHKEIQVFWPRICFALSLPKKSMLKVLVGLVEDQASFSIKHGWAKDTSCSEVPNQPSLYFSGESSWSLQRQAGIFFFRILFCLPYFTTFFHGGLY